MDISVVPQTNPSLGLKHGHEKLDVVTRSASKRRPASKRRTLLLDSKKEILMGNERVDLSDPGDGRLLRQTSLDKQVSSYRQYSSVEVDTSSNTSPCLQSDSPRAVTEEQHTPKQDTPELEKPKPPAESKKPAAPRVETAAADINQPMARPRRQSIVEYMESLHKAKYNSLSRPSQALETQEEEPPVQTTPHDTVTKTTDSNSNGEETRQTNLIALARLTANSQKTKTEPVKKPGMASETEKKENVPAWVSIAQVE